MKKVLIFIIAGMVAFSFRPAPETGNTIKFEWLKGTWMMKKKNGGAIMETWIIGNDSTLNGESLSISATGISKVLESLELSYRKEEYYYTSTVKGQNNNQAVSFKITSHSETGFVAENPEHDFPKRIIYELIGKDSVHAFIDGGPDMPDKKSDFYYSRYK